jgi:hypothetical protein
MILDFTLATLKKMTSAAASPSSQLAKGRQKTAKKNLVDKSGIRTHEGFPI